MYVIKNKDSKQTLNLIIESKDVENDKDLREKEGPKIECAKKFFNQISKDCDNKFKIEFKKQIKSDEVIKIIKKINGE